MQLLGVFLLLIQVETNMTTSILNLSTLQNAVSKQLVRKYSCECNVHIINLNTSFETLFGRLTKS